jgi:predicted esterase
VLSGYTARREECVNPGQLWVQDGAKFYSIRYFANFGKAFRKPPPAVVIFFKGDFLGFDWSRQGGGVFYIPGVDSKRVYQSTMRMLADAGNVPFVIVSRPGTMGSSGDHKHKFWRSEARIMNSAIDMLQEKFGFARIVLAGHSGGAMLVANLLPRRADVICAVMASGAAAIQRFAADNKMNSNITALWEDPIDNVAQIPDKGQPLIVLTGEGDPNRPVKYQEEYANSLLARNLNAVFWVLFKKGDPHDTQWEAVHAAIDCSAGKSLDQIRRRFKVINH